MCEYEPLMNKTLVLYKFDLERRNLPYNLRVHKNKNALVSYQTIIVSIMNV